METVQYKEQSPESGFMASEAADTADNFAEQLANELGVPKKDLDMLNKTPTEIALNKLNTNDIYIPGNITKPNEEVINSNTEIIDKDRNKKRKEIGENYEDRKSKVKTEKRDNTTPFEKKVVQHVLYWTTGLLLRRLGYKGGSVTSRMIEQNYLKELVDEYKKDFDQMDENTLRQMLKNNYKKENASWVEAACRRMWDTQNDGIDTVAYLLWMAYSSDTHKYHISDAVKAGKDATKFHVIGEAIFDIKELVKDGSIDPNFFKGKEQSWWSAFLSGEVTIPNQLQTIESGKDKKGKPIKKNTEIHVMNLGNLSYELDKRGSSEDPEIVEDFGFMMSPTAIDKYTARDYDGKFVLQHYNKIFRSLVGISMYYKKLEVREYNIRRKLSKNLSSTYSNKDLEEDINFQMSMFLGGTKNYIVYKQTLEDTIRKWLKSVTAVELQDFLFGMAEKKFPDDSPYANFLQREMHELQELQKSNKVPGREHPRVYEAFIYYISKFGLEFDVSGITSQQVRANASLQKKSAKGKNFRNNDIRRIPMNGTIDEQGAKEIVKEMKGTSPESILKSLREIEETNSVEQLINALRKIGKIEKNEANQNNINEIVDIIKKKVVEIDEAKILDKDGKNEDLKKILSVILSNKNLNDIIDKRTKENWFKDYSPDELISMKEKERFIGDGTADDIIPDIKENLDDNKDTIFKEFDDTKEFLDTINDTDAVSKLIQDEDFNKKFNNSTYLPYFSLDLLKNSFENLKEDSDKQKFILELLTSDKKNLSQYSDKIERFLKENVKSQNIKLPEDPREQSQYIEYMQYLKPETLNQTIGDTDFLKELSKENAKTINLWEKDNKKDFIEKLNQNQITKILNSNDNTAKKILIKNNLPLFNKQNLKNAFLDTNTSSETIEIIFDDISKEEISKNIKFFRRIVSEKNINFETISTDFANRLIENDDIIEILIEKKDTKFLNKLSRKETENLLKNDNFLKTYEIKDIANISQHLDPESLNKLFKAKRASIGLEETILQELMKYNNKIIDQLLEKMSTIDETIKFLKIMQNINENIETPDGKKISFKDAGQKILDDLKIKNNDDLNKIFENQKIDLQKLKNNKNKYLKTENLDELKIIMESISRMIDFDINPENTIQAINFEERKMITDFIKEYLQAGNTSNFIEILNTSKNNFKEFLMKEIDFSTGSTPPFAEFIKEVHFNIYDQLTDQQKNMTKNLFIEDSEFRSKAEKPLYNAILQDVNKKDISNKKEKIFELAFKEKISHWLYLDAKNFKEQNELLPDIIKNNLEKIKDNVNIRNDIVKIYLENPQMDINNSQIRIQNILKSLNLYSTPEDRNEMQYILESLKNS